MASCGCIGSNTALGRCLHARWKLLHKPRNAHDALDEAVSLPSIRRALQLNDARAQRHNLVPHVPFIGWPEKIVEILWLDREGIELGVAWLCPAAARLTFGDRKQEDVRAAEQFRDVGIVHEVSAFSDNNIMRLHGLLYSRCKLFVAAALWLLIAHADLVANFHLA
jgi:hypothetical protein